MKTQHPIRKMGNLKGPTQGVLSARIDFTLVQSIRLYAVHTDRKIAELVTEAMQDFLKKHNVKSVVGDE